MQITRELLDAEEAAVLGKAADCTFVPFDDREGWLAARRARGVGSSDAAVILGVSRFRSPLSLYYEKIGLGAPASPALEEARAWGNILEEPIAQRYGAAVGRFVGRPPANTLAVSNTYPFAVASVDRFLIGTREGGTPPPPGLSPVGVLEIKNAHYFMGEQWGEDNNNEPPVEYQIQLQHQLMVTGAKWGSIAALIGGSRFVWADRVRDEELIALLATKEAEFWQRVIDRRPPEADGSESSREILKKIYPKDTGEIITLPPEAITWHEELEVAKKLEKAAKADVDLYANKLRQAIGAASAGLLSNGWKYTNHWQERQEFVSPRSEFRVLRASKPKGAK